jgi:hypothetical protein
MTQHKLTLIVLAIFGSNFTIWAQNKPIAATESVATGGMNWLFLSLELLIVTGIIIWQARVFTTTRNKIKALREVMPNALDYQLNSVIIPVEVVHQQSPIAILTLLNTVMPKEKENDYRKYDPTHNDSAIMRVNLVSTVGNASPIFDRIRNALNTYLLRNRGAAADFHLVKDIVERHIDAEDHDINVSLPAPLYIGLFGTMVGIVAGLILFVTGVNQSTNAETTEGYSLAVNELLLGVVFGMIASASGLLMTVFNSVWLYRGAKSDVEARKNGFYTFIQTELLPVLNQSVNSSVITLQQTIGDFNRQFASNLQQLDGLMSRNHETLMAQSNVLKTLGETDLTRFADANIRILAELKTSTTHLEQFGQYIQQLNDFFKSVYQLNERAEVWIDRTDDFNDIALNIRNNLGQHAQLMDFLESHFGELEKRGNVIVGTVTTVDDKMRKAIEGLTDSSVQQIHELRHALEAEQGSFNATLRSNRDLLDRFLIEMNKHLGTMQAQSQAQNSAIQQHLTEGLMRLNESSIRLEKITTLWFENSLWEQSKLKIRKVMKRN